MPPTPAYGRDYESKAAVLRDFDDDKDFLLQPAGCLINRSQIEEDGKQQTNIRYARLTKVVVLSQNKNGTWTAK